MSSERERYSKLAPLGVELRTKLAISAVNFFAPLAYKDNCAVLGKTPDPKAIRPLGSSDFVDYLQKKGILDAPLRYAERIRQLLERLAASGILIEMGQGSNVMLPKLYYCLKELTALQKTGVFWLAPALGDDFLFHLAAPGIVHITGVNKEGDVCAGTGIIFHPHHILTCAHVVNDMTVDQRQNFQCVECTIDKKFAHEKADIAVIRVSQPLQPVPGLSFLSPRIAQPVVTLGYPKIPFARKAALTIQRGEVTNESVTTLDGHRVFLYSAIARPGNSGGPIISSDGHVIGITMQNLLQDDRENAFSPHYAGIPSDEIAGVLDDLGIDVQIPFEDFN